MQYYSFTQLASAEYNCGAYGAGNYSEGQCQTSTGGGGTTPTTPTSGEIAATGMNILLLLIVGLVLLIGSAVYFVRLAKKRRQLVSSPVASIKEDRN